MEKQGGSGSLRRRGAFRERRSQPQPQAHHQNPQSPARPRSRRSSFSVPKKDDTPKPPPLEIPRADHLFNWVSSPISPLSLTLPFNRHTIGPISENTTLSVTQIPEIRVTLPHPFCSRTRGWAPLCRGVTCWRPRLRGSGICSTGSGLSTSGVTESVTERLLEEFQAVVNGARALEA